MSLFQRHQIQRYILRYIPLFTPVTVLLHPRVLAREANVADLDSASANTAVFLHTLCLRRPVFRRDLLLNRLRKEECESCPAFLTSGGHLTQELCMLSLLCIRLRPLISLTAGFCSSCGRITLESRPQIGCGSLHSTTPCRGSSPTTCFRGRRRAGRSSPRVRA